MTLPANEMHTRNAVWQTMLDADRLNRYYGVLADRHRARYRWLRFVLIFAAVGGVTRLTDLLPEAIDWLPEVSALAIIALVIWDFMADYPRKAAILHTIAIECNDYSNQLHQIWLSLTRGEVDVERVIAQVAHIDTELSRITARAGVADIAENHKLNQQAATETYSVARDRFYTEVYNNG